LLENKSNDAQTNDKNLQKISQQERDLKQFQSDIQTLAKSNKDMQVQIVQLTLHNQELETKYKQILKDMGQNEIIHEKETFKLNAKLKEYKYIINEQKETIIEMDNEI
jgi:hypothetical protein